MAEDFELGAVEYMLRLKELDKVVPVGCAPVPVADKDDFDVHEYVHERPLRLEELAMDPVPVKDTVDDLPAMVDAASSIEGNSSTVDRRRMVKCGLLAHTKAGASDDLVSVSRGTRGDVQK